MNTASLIILKEAIRLCVEEGYVYITMEHLSKAEFAALTKEGLEQVEVVKETNTYYFVSKEANDDYRKNVAMSKGRIMTVTSISRLNLIYGLKALSTLLNKGQHDGETLKGFWEFICFEGYGYLNQELFDKVKAQINAGNNEALQTAMAEVTSEILKEAEKNRIERFDNETFPSIRNDVTEHIDEAFCEYCRNCSERISGDCYIYHDKDGIFHGYCAFEDEYRG